MIPIVHHPAYEFDIGPHVFPTRKYRLVLDRLVRENTISIDDVIAPRPVTDDDVRLVHTGEYVRKITQACRSRLGHSRPLCSWRWSCLPSMPRSATTTS